MSRFSAPGRVEPVPGGGGGLQGGPRVRRDGTQRDIRTGNTFCLSVCIFVHVSLFLFIHLSVSLPLSLFISLTLFIFLFLPFFIYLPLYILLFLAFLCIVTHKNCLDRYDAATPKSLVQYHIVNCYKKLGKTSWEDSTSIVAFTAEQRARKK